MKKYTGTILWSCLCFFIWIEISHAGELQWDNISREISSATSVSVSGNDSQIIYLGTEKGVFRTEDKGLSWRLVLRVKGTNQKINFLLEDEKGNIYAASGGGLFLSHNSGRDWKKIFRSNDIRENNCQTLLILSPSELYLGTEGGLFLTKDKTATWRRIRGRLGNICVRTLAFDKLGNNIYLGAEDGVYRIKLGEDLTERIRTITPIEDSVIVGSEDETGNNEIFKNFFVKNICLNPFIAGTFYLATSSGIYMYEDHAKEWKKFPEFGLIDRRVNFLFIKELFNFYAATRSGIYLYKNEKWESVSAGLVNANVYAITSDKEGNLYAATDKGLFKAKQAGDNPGASSLKAKYAFKKEPPVQELHQAAIKYANIIDPSQIETSRKQARLKAILPELSIDYEKTISAYSNSSCTRFAIGPWDWGISLKWNLGDLIWSEQQRLIDAQVRLMIQLRNDILDEITKIYFERMRVKMELLSDNLDQKKKSEKELKLDELATSLDALTGGYFSKFLQE